MEDSYIRHCSLFITYTSNGYYTSLMYIHNIPSILKVTYIRVREQSIFFIRIKQGKVFHNNSYKKTQIYIMQLSASRTISLC